MHDWIDYYDSTPTIYVSKRHRDLHFELIARDIIGYITAKDEVVLDYSCGEALSAPKVAEACGLLILAEPAPGVRGRLIGRFGSNPKIGVRSLDDVRKMPEASVDLAVMNSVAQYMTSEELDSALSVMRGILKPSGRLVVGDVLRPDAGMPAEVYALLRFAAKHGFLKDALVGLLVTALSDYRRLRSRVGLRRYSEAEMIARLARCGFSAARAGRNIGHNPWRMTFVAHPALVRT
jgi:SAM-dependent methyltransferase